MRTIANNFKGSGVFEYRIKLQDNGKGITRVDIYIKTAFRDTWTFIDNTTGFYDMEAGEGSSVGFEKALRKAEQNWGIKLIKADLQVA